LLYDPSHPENGWTTDSTLNLPYQLYGHAALIVEDADGEPLLYSSAFAGSMQPEYPDIVIAPLIMQPLVSITITITDTAATAAGYVQIARLFCGGGFELSTSPVYGMRQGVASETTMHRTMGGTAYYDIRPQRKTLQISAKNLPDNEAMAHLWQMQRTLGTHGELYFILNPEATSGLERQRSMLCSIAELSPLESAFYNATNASFQLEEIV
ncbi:MAG: hypothetical protein PHN84_03235, partial [Desulfuromonadaceae bacterium]|nr:hypothetical protein [Desulfuromonadaceae bacterium]